MSRTAFEDQLLLPTGLSPERARRWCLLASLRTLRLSAWRGRPMSLPNLLRLYRRRWAEVTDAAGPGGAEQAMAWLTRLYRAEQPFEGTDWRWWRGRLPRPSFDNADSITE